ncbi:hypothetical protein PT974_04970 [Cladobotryum mycophilum]|uniref:Uncharacterized protein n=1 Tax=Cladobotryum mycophilum TaxID=491253 RepID=A0ABR0SQU5_9HYPO
MDIPVLIQKIDAILDERAQWAVGATITREETPTTSDLQRRLESISTNLASWRSNWIRELTASEILNWALFRMGDDMYRLGIYSAQGPDVYRLNMSTCTDLDIPLVLTDQPEATPTIFG